MGAQTSGTGGGADLDSGLVFHFPFDGTLDDIAGGQLGLQVSADGGELGYAPGVDGHSLDLSENNAHVILANESSFAVEDLTLSF